MAFFNDVQTTKGWDNMPTPLFYVTDHYKFFDTYYYEINSLYRKTEESSGFLPYDKYDLKYWLGWFGLKKIVERILKLYD